MERTCLNCCFWEPDGDEGLCHRHAPRPLVATVHTIDENPSTFFPSTCRGDWCGDFQLKEQEGEQ